MKKSIMMVAVLAFAAMFTTFSSCRKSVTEDKTPAKEGLYLGIIGFNNEFKALPLGLLNQSTKTNFEKFVDTLTMKHGTYLYHAVNMGLDNLTSAKIPENLINVSLVTFTDGLDQGSYTLSGFTSSSDYLSAINSRIGDEVVGGINISAYSIGVRGSDVSDIESFRENLKKLSSDPVNNVFEVSNMSEASTKFAEIARRLYSQNTSYNITLKISPQDSEKVLRFTFDNIPNAGNSHCYIEGTYVRTPSNLGQLKDLRYVGLESTSGSVVTASYDNGYDLFTFRNLIDTQGQQITTSYVQLWEQMSTGQWLHNSEFTSTGSSETVHESNSAMIMLMLDCSSSLGSDFTNMKTAANGFIETLSGNYAGE